MPSTVCKVVFRGDWGKQLVLLSVSSYSTHTTEDFDSCVSTGWKIDREFGCTLPNDVYLYSFGGGACVDYLYENRPTSQADEVRSQNNRGKARSPSPRRDGREFSVVIDVSAVADNPARLARVARPTRSRRRNSAVTGSFLRNGDLHAYRAQQIRRRLVPDESVRRRHPPRWCLRARRIYRSVLHTILTAHNRTSRTAMRADFIIIIWSFCETARRRPDKR